MKLKQCIFIMMILLFVTAFSAYSKEDIPTADNSAFKHPQRPAAVFDHDEHNEKANLEDDCSYCHHVYENKKLIKDESSEGSSCSECHPLKSSLKNAIPLRTAFHKRCKECHFKSDKGPVLCGECHVKKAR
ncbi:MAG: cytochrome c3 family protein [Deltaproteobacteria bacterium]|nr:cytochrome c3 family protein [Deltaproteobacteria bacterium]